MAKLPKDSMGPTAVEEESDRKPRVFLDIPAEDVEGLSEGDSVTVTYKGKVVGFSVHKSESSARGSVDLEDPDVKISADSGQAADLDETLDEE